MKMKKGIYGAGYFGKKLLKILGNWDMTIDCFIQSKRENQLECVEGLPVITMDELLEEKEKYLIFIAIRDFQAVAQIWTSLRHSGYDMSLVYDMHCFIEANEKYERHVKTGDKECLLCSNRFDKYVGTGHDFEIFRKQNIIGGGYRKNGICPCCHGADRTRWVYWVLREYTDILKKKCVVVHFAPEKGLKEILEQNPNCDYYPGDIRGDGMGIHKIDVTNIVYADEMADYIIINHVMEHVKDEGKAISELKRVLKKDGKLIMSFPINTMQETFEDDAIISELDREKYYGQKNHVRLYGTDYKIRFEGYGLKVQVYSPKDYLANEAIERYGLLRDDIVLICSKEE